MFVAVVALGAFGTQRAIAPARAIVLTMPPAVALTGVVPDGDALTWPLDGAVTGTFGEPRPGHVHEGIDIPRPVGTPIRAAGTGTVVMREWQDGYGNYTCIAHVEVLTCYAHQERFHTKLGAHVQQGEVIGYTGDTGTSEAPHLHFEVRRGRRPWGKPMDPIKFLPREPDRLPAAP